MLSPGSDEDEDNASLHSEKSDEKDEVSSQGSEGSSGSSGGDAQGAVARNPFASLGGDD